jgi:hypothetical protein
MSTARPRIGLLALVCVIAFIAVNVAFYLLSASYFESHRGISLDDALHTRMVFTGSAAIITVVCFVVGLQRRALGHALTAALGLLDFVGSILALWYGLPPVLVVALLAAGVLLPLLGWYSYRRSRAAWGFLTAMCGVFAVVSLFGAPRLRDALNVSLWTMMLAPALYLVAAITLYLLRDDYASGGPPA